ncbi:LysE family translocator [Aeromonas media]|uniref:LysE family translocator n=1 Tax=Aeromonas media TaxID=651 RepID=A0A6M4YJL5_AERME|nr:LysE family translocator [Aeromonas media]MBP8112919.1 LysE family translocator [Aeromonas sp.]AHX63425.1 lysine exporter protein [Aeromonas media WS]MBS4640669.1 LysE family translocator [Aeromonas media]MCV3289747.1 LysE family translocator [Aeromonas media]QHQ50128.1 LysE family transporter [Aeromonas media]
MDLNWLFPLAGFALITCGTPGPNNMLLTSAGAAQGFRRSIPLLVGVVGGINLMILATALGLGVMFEKVPLLHDGLKLLGSAYLLWLAWKVANASGPADGSRPLIPAHQGAMLQLLNPKAWMMALSAISGFTLAGEAYWPSAGWVLGIFFVTGLYTGAFWVLFGAQVRRLIRTARGWRRFNLGMGIATAACVLMIWV